MREMYVPALDRDGTCMGKTIALKLSKKEELLIAEWNKKGMTNSDILRSALRHYFEDICDESSGNTEMKNVFIKQEKIQADVVDSLKQLQGEVHVLEEQVRCTQQQVENNIQTLQRQLYLLSTTDATSQEVPVSVKSDIARNIHQQVDEFLTMKAQKNSIIEEMD